jgi:ribosome-associated heat shock protein Hsp15
LDRQRVDKWLWHARVVRTRTAAAALAAEGHVRVNGRRIDAPSHAVRAGDVLTIALDRTVRILRVLAFADRRRGAEAAAVLWDDLTPPPASAPSPGPNAIALREPGAGRPTKRDRRALDRLRSEDDT